MPRFAKAAIAAIMVSVAMACADCAHAQSWGYMHLPSTVGQAFGYGYGGGHHAPIVKTPAQRPARMERWTRVAACYGPLAPAAYAPAGCNGGACYGGATVPIDASQPNA